MNTRTTPLLFLLLLACGCAKPPPDDGLGPFQGHWSVLEFNERTQQADSEKLKKMDVIFDKDQFVRIEITASATETSISAGGGTGASEGGSVRVDNSKTPKEIDIVSRGGKNAGKVQMGIFALEGDKLTLCIADLGSERPTDLAAGAKVTLMVLQRKP
jgi:uncharacterized protein (TIGR03067 family)